MRRLPRRPAARVILLFLVTLLFCAPLVAAEVHTHPGVSPVDESPYIDYLYRVHEGRILLPHGQLMGDAAMREITCRGIQNGWAGLWPVGAGCMRPPFDYTRVPDIGFNSADIYPPTYFILTDLGARVLMGVGVTDNLVDAARMVGAVWMAWALVVLYLLARELGARRWSAVLAMAVAGANPLLLHYWFHVTPDAGSVLLGGLVLLAAVRWDRGRIGLHWLVLASLAAVSVKSVNVLAVLLVGAYFVVRLTVRVVNERCSRPVTFEAPSAQPEPTAPSELVEAESGQREESSPPTTPPAVGAAATGVRHEVVGLVASLGTALVAMVGWLLLRAAISPPGVVTRYDIRNATHAWFRFTWVKNNLFAFLKWQDLGQPRVPLLFVVASAALVVGAVVVVLTRPWRSRVWAVAVATLVATFAGPLTIVMITVVTQRAYVASVQRYGLSIVAASLALTAVACRPRWAQALLGVLALALLAVSLAWLR